MSIASNLAEVRDRIAAAAASGRPSGLGRHARRGLEDVRRRSRARGVARRAARVRREQGPGRPAEDRRNGRHPGKVASHRPSAVEQGEEGGGRVRLHPVGGLGRAAAAARRRGRRTDQGAPRSTSWCRSTSPARRRSSARRRTRPRGSCGPASTARARPAARADAASALERRPGADAPLVRAPARASRPAGRDGRRRRTRLRTCRWA